MFVFLKFYVQTDFFISSVLCARKIIQFNLNSDPTKEHWCGEYPTFIMKNNIAFEVDFLLWRYDISAGSG